MGTEHPAMLARRDPLLPDPVLRDRGQVEGYVAGICFKTGPPALLGAELEFTVHHTDDPTRPLDPHHLKRALGPYAPTALDPDSPAAALAAGSQVTVEPGGQVEISTAPAHSLAALYAATEADRRQLADLLAGAGLRLGDAGLDAHRPPRRILGGPRYAAMERGFDRRGPHGRIMMGSTAGLQVCLDAGLASRAGARWALLHEVGPALLAAFATSRWHAGRDTGVASARMLAWLGIDPARTHPVGTPPAGTDAAGVDVAVLAGGWARYALAAPLLCLRRADGCWDPPPGVTFGDWVDGALPTPPTTDDLAYHLSTLFPPVRPRGYLEVRYLDAQPGGEWIAPTAVLAALLADEGTVDAARELAAPAAGRWAQAARRALADRPVARAAHAVLELACRSLDRTGLPAPVADVVSDIVGRRLTGRGRP